MISWIYTGDPASFPTNYSTTGSKLTPLSISDPGAPAPQSHDDRNVLPRNVTDLQSSNTDVKVPTHRWLSLTTPREDERTAGRTEPTPHWDRPTDPSGARSWFPIMDERVISFSPDMTKIYQNHNAQPQGTGQAGSSHAVHVPADESPPETYEASGGYLKIPF